MRYRMLGILAAGTVFLAPPAAGARLLRRLNPAHHRSSNITLRKRLHVNPLIAEPGTAEIDWGLLYSFSSTNFSLPSALKYTPEGSSLLWGRTEYSVAFDSLTNADYGGGRLTQFSQSLTLAGTTVVYDGEKLDLAMAPQATFFVRDENGMRLGAVMIARYDFGRNSLGGTLSWSGATRASDTNPAGTFDAGAGFGRRLGGSAFLEKLTPHANLVWEKSSGIRRVVSLFEGVEYEMNDRLAIDVSGQHFALAGGAADHQIVIGLTLAVGGKGRR